MASSLSISRASATMGTILERSIDIPRDITFNIDGTKMYVIGSSGDDVNEYSLSTAYDVSTASYTQPGNIARKQPG